MLSTTHIDSLIAQVNQIEDCAALDAFRDLITNLFDGLNLDAGKMKDLLTPFAIDPGSLTDIGAVISYLTQIINMVKDQITAIDDLITDLADKQAQLMALFDAKNSLLDCKL